MKNTQKSFGSCRFASEDSLQGGGFKYPKWYIEYLQGYGDKKFSSLAKSVLDYLSDETWKVQVARRGVGVGTVEALVELQLIKVHPAKKLGDTFVAGNKEVITDVDYPDELARDIANTRGFIGAYKITKRGIKALERGYLP